MNSSGDECEFPAFNASEAEIKTILTKSKHIAMVGLSPKPHRASYGVAAYMLAAGYRVTPVNPNCRDVLGQKAVSSLTEITDPVDIVDIFRRPEMILPVVEEAIKIGAKTVWMQLGIVNNAAARKATEAGLQVVMNTCIKVAHQHLT